jgi:hypothetical protein
MNKRENEISTQKVYQCYHCGNKTLMNLVSEHREDWGNEEFRGYTISQIYICPICQNATYIERYWEDGMIGANYEDYEDEKICYPVISLETNFVPDKIKTAYEAALKVRNTDSALCLIGLRRTLEMICNEQGAAKGNLVKKIEELANKNILPPTLKEATDITRHFGNSAAHAETIEISTHELNLIVEFIKSVMDYIYVIPHKMIKFKKMDKENE